MSPVYTDFARDDGLRGGPSALVGRTIGRQVEAQPQRAALTREMGSALQRRLGEIEFHRGRQEHDQAERASNQHPAGDLNVDDAVLRGSHIRV